MAHIARKRFGQHFLSDGGIIDAIVHEIAPQPGDAMVEIGPGLAALTQPLVERLGRLTVIELDRDLAKRLRDHPQLDVIESALERCDEFVAIGTSGAVYPAAGFVLIAAEYGARTLELNLAESEITPLFDESRLGPASLLVAAWVDELV